MITSENEIPFIFGCKELANILGVSKFTARQLMHSEGFPVHVISQRNYRIYKAEFMRWLEASTDKRTSTSS